MWRVTIVFALFNDELWWGGLYKNYIKSEIRVKLSYIYT
jgi:hypothetical protein